MRKEETSCAEDGSKGVGWKVSAGSWRIADDDDDDEDEGEEEDLRPVRESQNDILSTFAANKRPPTLLER